MTMPNCPKFAGSALPPLDAASLADLQALAAEAMGWQPLEQGAYLHQGDAHAEENTIHVVGVPDLTMAGMNVLLLV